MEKLSIKVNDVYYRIRFGRYQISTKITDFARQISKDYQNTSPPVLLWVSNGGAFLGVDLARALDSIGFLNEISSVILSRYADDEQGGITKILSPLSERLSNRHVIVIDDCIDQGYTLNFLNEKLQELEPKLLSIAFCTLFLKKSHDKLNFEIKYLGWEIGDSWIVGQGLDCHQFGRGLLGVYERE